MSAQNPQKVVDAACEGEIVVSGIRLRPFVLGLFPVLQKINSPLLADRTEKRKMDTQDILRLILCLTVPPAEARRLINQGIEAFDEAALGVADGIRMDLLPEVALAIQRQFSTAVSTAPGGGGSASTADEAKRLEKKRANDPVSDVKAIVCGTGSATSPVLEQETAGT